MDTIRKLSALLLALVMVFGLAACAVDQEKAAEAVQFAAEVISEAVEQAEAEETEMPAQEVPAAAEEETETAAEEDPAAAPEGAPEAPIEEDGWYTSREDVALYLYTYGRLPGNFITKNEAKALGWSGGGLDDYADGKSIGGDRFGNYEGILPDGDYHECDIDTMHASSRGAKRIVYSSDGRIYYTGDHYESFELLYGEE